MPNTKPLIELKGHTEGEWRLCDPSNHRRGTWQKVSGIESLQPDGTVLAVVEAGEYYIEGKPADMQLAAASTKLLALCTAMATKLTNNGDARWVNALYESAGIMPPALVRREALGYDETPTEGNDANRS